MHVIETMNMAGILVLGRVEFYHPDIEFERRPPGPLNVSRRQSYTFGTGLPLHTQVAVIAEMMPDFPCPEEDLNWPISMRSAPALIYSE